MRKESVFGASWQNLDIGDSVKLSDIDEETGAWIWPEGYQDSYIAEIEQCHHMALTSLSNILEVLPPMAKSLRGIDKF